MTVKCLLHLHFSRNIIGIQISMGGPAAAVITVVSLSFLSGCCRVRGGSRCQLNGSRLTVGDVHLIGFILTQGLGVYKRGTDCKEDHGSAGVSYKVVTYTRSCLSYCWF